MYALSRVVRNQKGAGLMMAGLALAALGAGAFMLGDMFIKNDEVLRKDSRVLAYRHLVDSVRKNLYAGNACTLALGSALGGSGKSLAAGMSIPAMNAAKGAAGAQVSMEMKLGKGDEITKLEPGMDFKTGTSIKNIYIQKWKNGRNDDEIRLHPEVGAPPLKAGYFRMIIEPDHKGINIWNKDASGKYIHESFFIDIYAYYNSTTNQIYSCFDPASDATYCTEIQKGAYDHRATASYGPVTAELRCQPDRVCMNYKGGLAPEGTPCPLPYTATRIGGGDTLGGGSKVQSCTWCHPIPKAFSLSDLGTTNSFRLVAGADDIGATDICGAGGFNNAQSDSYYYQNDWADMSYFAGGGATDTNLTSDANGCASADVTCPNDGRDHPDGHLAMGPNPENRGGLDGNRCYNDCSNTAITNHPGGCNAGVTCPDDLPGAPYDCVNECTGAAKTAYVGCDDMCTAENECPPPEPDPAPECGCFLAGTQITMSDGTYKTIEDILNQERVADSRNNRVVTETYKMPYKGRVYGINGGRHFFTPNHPFMTMDGWKSLNPEQSRKDTIGIPFKKLQVGDVLITKDGWEVIYSLDYIKVDDYVYNLTVQGTHEYYANDYLVHNMDMKNPCQ